MNDKELDNWVSDQRFQVKVYLEKEGIDNPNVGEWPAFEVAPYFAIWAIESKRQVGQIGWWAFSGDCPTDYISGDGVTDPRQALEKLLENWSHYLSFMKNNSQPPNTTMGKGVNLLELADLLERRILIMKDWLEDDAIWFQ